MGDKLIIEARLNEYAGRDRNPNVPWSPQEIARDAVRCHEAGAAIVHFHVRDAQGHANFDPATLQEIVARIRDTTDALIHPTLGVFAADTSAAARLAPIEHIVAAGLVPDFIPLDMGSANVASFDPTTNSFQRESAVYLNTTATLRHFAEYALARKIKPYLVTWNIPMLRTIGAFQRMGLLQAPSFISLVLSADPLFATHPATLHGLRAYTDFLPTHAHSEWSVTLAGGSLLPLATHIIEQGGHIAIGLGDHGYTELGQPTNAELIRHIVDIARRVGREIATPAQARAMLGMTAN